MQTTICLIDDDEDEQYLFKDAIVSFGGNLNVVTSGHPKITFEEILNGKIEKPMAIFLDLNMPVMTGWDCIQYLKSEVALRDIPVIVYTTSFLEDDQIKARHLGAAGFITKPYTFSDLCNTVKIEILKLGMAYL